MGLSLGSDRDDEPTSSVSSWRVRSSHGVVAEALVILMPDPCERWQCDYHPGPARLAMPGDIEL
jgi:hypothetical protein